MAKRKRLTPAQPGYLDTETPVLESKMVDPMPARAPIAQVAGEASAASALQELAGEMKRARDAGRMILDLPEAQIDAGYLVRDRLMADEEELAILMDSLRSRGQQTPIEVVALEQGRYGLISGWRRLTALRRLGAETVQAILRQPQSASDAYIAMVEENEIRVGLSYYERARVAAKAVEQGVYASEKQALLQLYSSASRAKRSKIRSFLTLYHAADMQLRFPMAISERLGLALVKALEADPTRSAALMLALERTAPDTAEAEIACLQTTLASFTAAKPKTVGPKSVAQPIEGVDLKLGTNRITLSGAGVTRALQERLIDWLKTQP